jgi:hypothetical protein
MRRQSSIGGPGQITIGAVHSIAFEQDRWKIWYVCGNDREHIGGKPLPQCHIRHVATDLKAIP